jgi:uncharacterized protein YlxW (UPF0749 family)
MADTTESVVVKIPPGVAKKWGPAFATIAVAWVGAGGMTQMGAGSALAQEALAARVVAVELEQARRESAVEKIDELDTAVTTLTNEVGHLSKTIDANHQEQTAVNSQILMELRALGIKDRP